MKTHYFYQVSNQLLKVSAMITTLLTLTMSSVNAADNIENIVNTCVSCHGKQGVSLNNNWPNLAGQKQGYLIKEITAFRDGTRKNPLMSSQVKHLSDQQINALANYFSVQKNTTKAAKTENIKGKHVRARCISCHGMSGITVNTLWPNLAGQKAGYLEKQLLAFKNGQRNSPIMEVIAKELTDDEIKNVAQYYNDLPASKE